MREIRALPPNSEIWDAAVPGFGARRQFSEAVAYVLLYRTADGRSRRYTIGRHGAPWTPDAAREEARRLLGEVAKGGDPAGEKQTLRRAITVAELARAYLADAEAGRLLIRGGRTKKPGTLLADRGRIENHVIPLLGHLRIAAVTRQDVEKFMHAIAAAETAKETKVPGGLSRVRGGRGVATRTVNMLGAIFTYAVDRHMRPDNPVSRLRKFAEGRRERRLSDEEYAALGHGLCRAEAEGIWPFAVAAGRFLAFSGWRSGETLELRWRDVDIARRTATLPDTKTGRSMRPLSNAACDLLRTISRGADDCRVFPATRGDGPLVGLKKMARRTFRLGDCRPM